MRPDAARLIPLASLLICTGLATAGTPPRVQTSTGALQGEHTGKVFAFKGIPYAKPPVGDLRWRPPQAAVPWRGILKATSFGPRCMQGPIYPDMKFRDKGPSEDCLYLNVWTPSLSAGAHLPVMVWIYGGGFQAGAASEPRQDGSHLTAKGVVVVSMNYRLGLFGFLSHPALTAESAHRASGNYGLLDQAAALAWVQKNISAFGGDPANVTIFGESAGSISVSAQMASPRSQNLFKRAIGESGSVFMSGKVRPQSLHSAEQLGLQLAAKVHASSLAALRAMPADQLLAAALADKERRFWPDVDGWFFPEAPSAIYAEGKQAHVALLAGWNADEQGYPWLLEHAAPTVENYRAKVHEDFGANAGEILKLFPAQNDEQVKQAARDLASDSFIAFSTWKWIDMQVKTGGGAPVYRYHFEQAPPQSAGKPSHGAYHSADIEYVFETLDSKELPWTLADRKLSETISSYWTNFAKTGDPNGAGLPNWPVYTTREYSVMHLVEGPDQKPHASPDTLKARYEALDSIEENARP